MASRMAIKVRESIFMAYSLIIMDDLPNDTNDIEKYVAYEKHLFIFIDGQSRSVTQSGEWMTVELSNTNQPTSGKRTSMGQLILGTQKNH